jgi:thioredoxin reductase
VYHCPYCHGWEVRDRPLAAYGAGASHLALLLTSLSDDIVLLTDGSSDLDPDDAEHLRQAGVVVRDDPVARLEADAGKLARVIFADGSSDDRAGLFFVPSFTPSPLSAQLGCELDESGATVIDEDGRTSVPGVFPPATRRPTRRRSCSPPQPGRVPPMQSTRTLPAGCFRSPTEARPRPR